MCGRSAFYLFWEGNRGENAGVANNGESRTPRQLRERLVALSKATAQIVSLVSSDGRMIEDQSGWTEFTGLRDYCDDRWMQAIHPQDVGQTLLYRTPSISAGEPFRLKHRLRRIDGSYRWVILDMTPILEGSGKIRQWPRGSH